MKFDDCRPKIIDRYIIRKFIGTYFVIMLLLVAIVIIFDISEHIEGFLLKKAPLTEIVVDWYLNFIPWFMTSFSPLIVFITVIFFTSKMASHTEIVAILTGGISFNRMLYPYFISALIVAVISLLCNLFVIPHGNKARFIFEDKYIRKTYRNTNTNIHYQIGPGELVYISTFDTYSNTANLFSLEKMEGNELKSKLVSDYAVWDTTFNGWKVYNYYIRTVVNDTIDSVVRGVQLDTVINLDVKELRRRDNVVSAMDYWELNQFIQEERERGSTFVNKALTEKHGRIAVPFSAFVLTLIGVSLSSRRVRGGIGLNIGIGITLSFAYILFQRFSEMFVQAGVAPPLIAAWIPNVVFAIIAIVLYRMAPK